MKRLRIMSVTLQPKAGGAKRTLNYAAPDQEHLMCAVEDYLSEYFYTYNVVSIRQLTNACLLEI